MRREDSPKSGIGRREVRQVWNVFSPKRFPRIGDKIANVFMVFLAAPLSLALAVVRGTRPKLAFTNVYRRLMPRDMLVTYRGCRFQARKGHREIWMLLEEMEPWAPEVFAPTSGSTVVDLGAHVGKYTLPSARLVGDQGRVIALEPIEENHRALRRNLRLNGFENVTTYQAAAYSESAEMWLVGWNLVASRDDISPEAGHPDRTVQVDAVAVDDLLAELGIGSVDYVKIDVEDQALPALQGMQRTLQQSKNVRVLIEVNREDYMAIDEFLQDLGFDGTPLVDTWGATGSRDCLYVKDDTQT